MSPASITKIRNDREARLRRHVELAKLLRDNPVATNIELAKALHVSRNTIMLDRLVIMELARNEALTETQIYRADQLTRIQEKWNSIEKSNMSDADKHREWRGWMKLEVEIRGTAAPTKSISTNINVDVDPATMGMYDRFLHSFSRLTQQQKDSVWIFIESLSIEEVDCQPPDDAPTWHLQMKQLPEEV